MELGNFNPETKDVLNDVEHTLELLHNESGKLKRPVETVNLPKGYSKRVSLYKRKKN